MRIALIGPRGTGKTTITKILSETLYLPVFSTDELIEQKAGIPIPEIVTKQKWEGFRDLEQDIISELSDRNDAIIDCGGGIVEREINLKNIKSSGAVIIYLTGSLDVLTSRIAGDTGRPPLTDITDPAKEMAAIIAERDPLYRAAADMVFDTDNKSPVDIANHIVEKLSKKFK